MPKEFAHWCIAEKARMALAAKGNAFAVVLEQYKHIYHLGAVAPDSLYYPVYMPQAAGFGRSAAAIHGAGFAEPFRNTGARYGNPVLPACQAFLAGAAAHVVADSVFHPFVYYFSGDSHSPDARTAFDAVARHRHIETMLDLHYYGTVGLPHSYSMYELLREKEISDNDFYEMMSKFYGCGISPAMSELALKTHAHAVYLARNRLVVNAIRLLNRAAFRRFETVRGMCYPALRRLSLPFFENQVRYKHPKDGVERFESVSGMETRALDLLASIFGNFTSVTGGDLLAPEIRDVLSDGTCGLEKGNMSYTDTSASLFELLK